MFESFDSIENMADENKVYRNMLGGKWVESASGKTIEVKSPVDGSLIGHIQAMTQAEVDASIANTKEALVEWAVRPMSERADILYQAADILENYTDELAEIMAMEIGKPYESSKSEIIRSAEFIRFTADAGQNIEGETVSGDKFPGGSRNKLSIVTQSPVGTVLAIAPFNYPVNLSISKVAPALIGGNTCILKPPTQGSVSALYLAEVFRQAGLPDGVFNTVTGKGSEIGDYLTTHPGINFINFTGSTEVGKHISAISTMVPMILELGGKDPAIICADTDIPSTARLVAAGAYSYSGQRCTAVKRVLVVNEIADQFALELKRQVEALKTGNPFDEGVTITPLISLKSAEYVQELIDDALAKGAVLLTGNRREGNLIYPTLLDHVTEDMRVAWEEPFGPVLPIIRCRSVGEALRIANKSQYGLQASVFTENLDMAFTVANLLEAGTVQINNKPERGPDHFPFLGVKDSGMGTQGIRYAITAMTRPKAIVITLNPETVNPVADTPVTEGRDESTVTGE